MQAILGFRKVIKHLDGHEVVIETDEITQPGYVKVIEGEGMPILDSNEKGNLYVTFKVTIPDFTDSELNELEDFFSKRNQRWCYVLFNVPIIKICIYLKLPINNGFQTDDKNIVL